MDETIAGHFTLDKAHPAPLALCGLRAFPALDRRDVSRRLVAVETQPALPPRPRFLQMARNQAPVPHCLMPIDHGPGSAPGEKPGWFIICAAPPGPLLSAAPAPMNESEVIRCVLLPAAAALLALSDQGLTHRAIRPDNVFRAGPREPITLGPGWATPPASQQPAACEPPYAAMCLPAGRGDGSIADDVYALGVTMLWCVLGGAVEWADGPALNRRKLEHGSLAALSGGARLTAMLQDLLSVMLAEDPDHRPSPALLMEPSQARSRRLATRPQQRASRPLVVGADAAWSARELSSCLARHPEQASGLLQSGAVDRWLRRVLGDSALAIELEEADERAAQESPDAPRVQALRLMRAVAILDPLAPLAWRGAIFFPDGLGPLLVAAQVPALAALAASLEELVANDVLTQWCACQSKRRDLVNLLQDAREWRGWLATRGPMGGVRRLIYGLNPFLPCASPVLGNMQAVRLGDLMPALEQAAKVGQAGGRAMVPFDGHIAAFIGARGDQKLLVDLGRLDGLEGPSGPGGQGGKLAVLGFFARLQLHVHPAPLPGLATWLLESGTIDLDVWHNRAARARVREALAARAAAGQITAMLLLAEDPAAHAADRQGAAQAAERLAAIEAAVAGLRTGAAARAAAAQRTGREIAAGLALLAALGAAVALALTA